MLLAAATFVLALCEPWCSNPCADLNGSPSHECNSCTEPNACRPGQPFYENAERETVLPQRETSPADMGGGGGAEPSKMGGYGSHGNPLAEVKSFVDKFEVGGCDLELVDHLDVTREMLMSAKKPFIIKGLTHNWTARSNWAKDALLAQHGAEPFQLHAKSSAALKDLLQWEGKYHMGHAVYPPGSCYSDPWRPYSPMLFGALRDDYYLPRYLGPMTTFQMGVGSGYGIGVPPENHPSSWFAVIKGKKRWVLRPPDAGTSRSGGYGTEPPGVMGRFGKGLCVPSNKPSDALHCDQQEGDVIWVPDYWWHETCGLDSFSIGLGALTYDGCCPLKDHDRIDQCTRPGEEQGDGYGVADIPECNNGMRECGGLPFPSHEGLQ